MTEASWKRLTHSLMNAVKARPRPKHVPQRTCVSCGSATAKRELIRLVRTPRGAVEPDPTGKEAGRGAYLCHSLQCWERAVNKGRLENALRTRLPNEVREALLRYGAQRLNAETS
jgi:predicted RNA-binding protein YlxR (DUF448 family)